MLTELRVLLPGSQLLTAFLIMLPFHSGFKQIIQTDKWIFMATFIFSITSLILFTAPAIQHRLMRPLRNRLKFKQFATRQIDRGRYSVIICISPGSRLGNVNSVRTFIGKYDYNVCCCYYYYFMVAVTSHMEKTRIHLRTKHKTASNSILP